jgi:lipopolysaccharide export system protein LptC
MQAYSNFVNISKYGLSLLMLLLLVFLVIIPLIGRDNSDMRMVFNSIEEQDESLPVMTKPRFQGVDDSNQPYMVTATRATQSKDNTITLDNVTADLTTKDKAWLALIAQQGILNLQANTLILKGDVQLYHDAGHEMRTEQVDINLKHLSAEGTTPIVIQGGFGRVTSDKFAITNRGDRMLFSQNVEMLVLP